MAQLAVKGQPRIVRDVPKLYSRAARFWVQLSDEPEGDMALGLFMTRNRVIEERAKSFEKRIGALATAVAGRFARGNIALQTGRTLTEARLREERDALGSKLRKR